MLHLTLDMWKYDALCQRFSKKPKIFTDLLKKITGKYIDATR